MSGREREEPYNNIWLISPLPFKSVYMCFRICFVICKSILFPTKTSHYCLITIDLRDLPKDISFLNHIHIYKGITYNHCTKSGSCMFVTMRHFIHECS